MLPILRKNNIILYRGREHRIIAIENDFINLQDYPNQNIPTTDKEIGSVPLSVKWLEKLGFKKGVVDGQEIYQAKSFPFLKEENNIISTLSSEIQYRHVHELQNAYFKKAGEDLKLSK